jgi:hypothetical protein
MLDYQHSCFLFLLKNRRRVKSIFALHNEEIFTVRLTQKALNPYIRLMKRNKKIT